MPAQLSSIGGALIGAALCISAVATIYAVVWRPAWLSNWLLRPRWFNSAGPRAGRFGAAIGASVSFVVGALLINTWARMLPPSTLGWALALCFLGLLGMVGPRL